MWARTCLSPEAQRFASNQISQYREIMGWVEEVGIRLFVTVDQGAVLSTATRWRDNLYI